MVTLHPTAKLRSLSMLSKSSHMSGHERQWDYAQECDMHTCEGLLEVGYLGDELSSDLGYILLLQGCKQHSYQSPFAHGQNVFKPSSLRAFCATDNVALCAWPLLA